MGSDDFFKRKKEDKKERKRGSKEPKANSYLIVTEGTKTEPYYFDGLSNYIKNKFGGNVDVKTPKIIVDGQGKCTVSLIEATAKLVNRSHNIYEHIWVVFDKDDFEDFDEAIILAEKQGFETAWSNQSFEYWIYLHFDYSDAALHRDDWYKKLNTIFKRSGINEKGYEKNLEDIFSILITNGSLKAAVSHAKRIETIHQKDKTPCQCDPCTKVHHLILQLTPFLKEIL
ncbi:RloB family protein [Acetobacterium sp.]|uniref:RloB family protein n=1 Tax=Acetobacterium sp. TaxID=1872094 RepID=UPI002F416FC4